MNAYKQTHRALCVYGELKRSKTAGGDKTQAFTAQINAALANLSIDDQSIIQCIYIMQMTHEEAAEALDCDTSTVYRRKRRAINRAALYLFPDQYLDDNGLHTQPDNIQGGL